MGGTPARPQLGVKRSCVQAANGLHGMIDFPGNYRQYFSPSRHVTIYGLSEAVEARRVSEAYHLGKLVFKVR
jgi:hypothetical protein